MTALDVIEGRARWSCETMDNLTWLKSLPDKCCDLVLTSPPYEAARTYSIGFNLRGQDWVDWCVERFMECLRVCKGLVAWIVEGQTRKFRWSATPALLMADLHRKGVHLRKPPIFKRVGIPGSGGPDWLRNDYEFIVCATSGGKLPWSDNTAMGHVPKWAPGGEMAHRLSNGARVNQWGPVGGPRGGGGRKTDGTSKPSKLRVSKGESSYPSHRLGTATSGIRNGDAETIPGHYDPPVLANPGNVIEWQLSIETMWNIILHYANATKANADQILRTLREAVGSGAIPQWFIRVDSAIFGAEILWTGMYGSEFPRTESGHMPWMPHNFSTEECQQQVLRPSLLCDSNGDSDASGTCNFTRSSESQKENSKNKMHGLRSDGSVASTSRRQKPDKQCTGESDSSLSMVPSTTAHKTKGNLPDMWASREAIQILWEFVRQALPEIQKAWQSFIEGNGVASLSTSQDCSGIINCLVGGGVMGSDLCHSNEAPFPESLAEFFVRSFAPENGIVCDPHSGSGTTIAVAGKFGRKGIACDLRESQTQLTIKRMQEKKEQAGLFASLLYGDPS